MVHLLDKYVWGVIGGIYIILVSLMFLMGQQIIAGVPNYEEHLLYRSLKNENFSRLRTVCSADFADEDAYSVCKAIVQSPAADLKNRGSALFLLGLLCEAKVACVPEDERNVVAAMTYFTEATTLGHRASFEGLSRCLIKTGNFNDAIKCWHQADFLDCSKAISKNISCGSNDDLIDIMLRASTKLPYISDEVLHSQTFAMAQTKLINVCRDLSGIGNLRADCLMARLYAQMRPCQQHQRQQIVKLLSDVISKTTPHQACQLIASTNALNALILAEDEDNKLTSLLGNVLYNQGSYLQAASYVSKSVHAGDLLAKVYYAVMLITGNGTEISLKRAFKLINSLTQSCEGRKYLSFFADSCDASITAQLTKEHEKNNAYASFLLGIVLFYRHENEQLAFQCLRKWLNKENLFAFYCCTRLCLQSKDILQPDETMIELVANVLSKDIDEDFRHEYCSFLKYLSEKNNVCAILEYCRFFLSDPSFIEDCLKYCAIILNMSDEHQDQCVRRLFKENYQKLLVSESKKHNACAEYIRAVAHEMRGNIAKEPHVKHEEWQASYAILKKSIQDGMRATDDHARIVRKLGSILQSEGKEEEAMNFFREGLSNGNSPCVVSCALVTMQYAKTTQQQFDLAWKVLQDCADHGNAEAQTILARIYSTDTTIGQAKFSVKADIEKAYHYACTACKSNLVDSYYLKARLLFEYGGLYGIQPDDQCAFALMNIAYNQKKNLESIDYYYMGRYSFDVGDYHTALEWFNRAPDFPGSLFYRGLIKLLQKDDHDKALDDVEHALAMIRDHKWPCAYNNYDRCIHPELIRQLRVFAESGNMRARVILARMVVRFSSEMVSVSCSQAQAWLAEAECSGCIWAQSFLGYLHAKGDLVEKSNQRSFELLKIAAQSESLNDYLVEEIISGLCLIAQEGNTKLAVQAYYTVIPLLIGQNSMRSLCIALNYYNNAEAIVVKYFACDQELAREAKKSGAWRSLFNLATTNADIAVMLALNSCLRFHKNMIDYETVRVEGLSLMDLGVAMHSKLLSHEEASDKYLHVARYCLKHNLCPPQEICNILSQALILDRNNFEAKHQLSNLYIECRRSDIPVSESLKRGQRLLEELVNANYPPALLEAGMMLLPELGQPSSNGKDRKKGLEYLKRAADLGCTEAMVVLVCQQDQNKRQMQVKLASRLAQDGLQGKIVTFNEFAGATQALATQDYAKAQECFAEYEKTIESPQNLSEAAIIYFNIKHDYALAINHLLRAITLARKIDLDIAGTVIERILKSVLAQLDENKEKDQRFPKFATMVRKQLQGCHYTI